MYDILRRKAVVGPATALAIGAALTGLYSSTRPNEGELKSIEHVSTYVGEQSPKQAQRSLGFTGIYGFMGQDLDFVSHLELDCDPGNALLPTTVNVSATSIVGKVYLETGLTSIDSEGNEPCNAAIKAISISEATDLMEDMLRRSFTNEAENDGDQTNNEVTYSIRVLSEAEKSSCREAVAQGAKVGDRQQYPC